MRTFLLALVYTALAGVLAGYFAWSMSRGLLPWQRDDDE